MLIKCPRSSGMGKKKVSEVEDSAGNPKEVFSDVLYMTFFII